MAEVNAGTVKGRLKLDTSDWKRGLTEAGRDTKKFAGDAEKGFGGLTRAVQGLGLAYVAAKTAEFGWGIVKLGADAEQTRMAFTTLLGTTQEADKHLSKLAEFAKRTPFEFDDLTRASRRMQALGFEADKVIPMLTSIGDATAAMGEGAFMVDRVVYALGQMRSATKVNREEINQLTEAGIPAWEILSKAIGKSTAETMKLASQGVIPADKAIQALLTGMSGKFGDSMAKQATTFNGQLSNLKDSTVELGKAFGNDLLPAATWTLQQIAKGVGIVNKALAEMRRTLNAGYDANERQKNRTKYEAGLPANVLAAFTAVQKAYHAGDAWRKPKEYQALVDAFLATGYVQNAQGVPVKASGGASGNPSYTIGPDGLPVPVGAPAKPQEPDPVPRIHVATPPAKVKARTGPTAAERDLANTQRTLEALENRLGSAQEDGRGVGAARNALIAALDRVVGKYGPETSIGYNARKRRNELRMERAREARSYPKGFESLKASGGYLIDVKESGAGKSDVERLLAGAGPVLQPFKPGWSVGANARPAGMVWGGVQAEEIRLNAMGLASASLDGMTAALSSYGRALTRVMDEQREREEREWSEMWARIGAGVFDYSRRAGGAGMLLANVGGAAMAGKWDKLWSPGGALKGSSFGKWWDRNNMPKHVANLAAVGGAIGSISAGEGGAFGGAISGASAGAAIGSYFPGVGTIIGAGIGALAGAIFGGNAAEEQRHQEHMAKVDAMNRALQRIDHRLEPVADIFRSMSLGLLPTGVLQGGGSLAAEGARGVRL